METQNDCEGYSNYECCSSREFPYVTYFCNMWTFFIKGTFFVKYGIQLWCYSIFQSELPVPDNQIKAWITTYTD